MGRFYLPPQVIVVVAVLAAVGAILIVLARPAAGRRAAARAGARRARAGPGGRARRERRARLRGRAGRRRARAGPGVGSAPRGARLRRPQAGARWHRGRPLAPRRPTSSPASAPARSSARPTTLAVAARRGRWLGVVTTHLPNGRLGWVDPAESAVVRARTRVRVTIDLSERRLVVRRGDRVLRRVTVAVGRPSSPDADRPLRRHRQALRLGASAPSYGCCILALSAHQPSLPSGWQGGDRIAVHGTNDPGSIGTRRVGRLPARERRGHALPPAHRSPGRPGLRPRVAASEPPKYHSVTWERGAATLCSSGSARRAMSRTSFPSNKCTWKAHARRARSSSAVVTGRWQAKRSQTYAAGLPSTRPLPARSGTASVGSGENAKTAFGR